MTGLHPTDERAVTALRVLRHPDLSASEQLDALLPLLEIPGVQKVLRSNLKPVFEDARTDGIDLSRPPADVHVWLQKPWAASGTSWAPRNPTRTTPARPPCRACTSGCVNSAP